MLKILKLRTRWKEIKNLPIKQGRVDLEKTKNWVSFINFFLLQLGIVHFLILTYFSMQTNIKFHVTGWLPIPEPIHWYYSLLILIWIRMLIVLSTYYLIKYIKNFAQWSEKAKNNALYGLALINLLTILIHLPLIKGLYNYMKGNEILLNHWFVGTFRRILTVNEREKLYQETVQNFLERIEATKEIKDQIKNWAVENTKSMLEKYEDGSVFATKSISENLEIQFEEIKKIYQEIHLGDQTKQSFTSWIYEKTVTGINYFNPFVADPKTCAASWAILIGTLAVTGLLVIAFSKSNLHIGNETTNKAVDQIKKVQAEVSELKPKVKNIFELADLTLQASVVVQEKTKIVETRLEKLDIKVDKFINVLPISDRRAATLQHIVKEQKKSQLLENVTKIYQKYQNKSVSMATIQEMMGEIIQEILKIN